MHVSIILLLSSSQLGFGFSACYQFRCLRKQRIMMRRNNLPEDMEMDILFRLPVKSLLRFRCVSKSWCARFQNQLFITNHYLKQTNKINNNEYANVSVLLPRLERRLYPEPNLCYFSLLDQTLRFKENIYFPDSKIKFMDTCNGLICWLNGHQITLWNPATREFKHLPKSHIKRSPVTVPYGMGFGFDSKTNDYKVIYFYTNTYDSIILRQVDLYTLSTDSWREVEIASDFPYFAQPEFDAYINGVYYWESHTSNCIISFDMVDEVFSRLPLPFDSPPSYWNLVLLNGYIAVVYYPSDEMNFEIWVMKEYGIKESWTKQLSIGSIPECYYPCGFWKNGGWLFIFNGRKRSNEQLEQLLLYDPNTQEIEKLQFHSPACTWSHRRTVIYVESLVPINGRREYEDERFIRLPTQMRDA